MHHVAFEPKVCRERTYTDDEGRVVTIPPTFSGYVTLRPPMHEERLEFASNPEFMEFLNRESEKKKQGEQEKLEPIQMKILLNVAKWSYAYYEKVSLTRLRDGYKFEDLDSLRCDSSCSPILQEIGTELSQGLQLGNN